MGVRVLCQGQSGRSGRRAGERTDDTISVSGADEAAIYFAVNTDYRQEGESWRRKARCAWIRLCRWDMTR